MKQKERFDEKPKQEHTEPKHHRKAVIKGITVYESFRMGGVVPTPEEIVEALKNKF